MKFQLDLSIFWWIWNSCNLTNEVDIFNYKRFRVPEFINTQSAIDLGHENYFLILFDSETKFPLNLFYSRDSS